MLVYDTWWAKITPFSNNFFWFPQFKGDKLYTKIMQKKKVIMLVQQLKTIVTIFLVLGSKKQYSILGMHTHSFP